jgi:lipopolysaccharide/colanic/teichoic acid biosynthesis glycosyltransferase
MRLLHTAKTAPSYRVVKRVFDMAISTLGVVACSPLFVLTGLFVLISMGPPVILSQPRVGHGGRTIYVYKFKTRRNPVDSMGRALSLHERSTHVGRALRARRLDELPQLFNVIKGDMTIVGPRPLPPLDQPPETSLRLVVAPGLTGLAQIHGGKPVSIDEKNALDEWYVRNACLWLDAEIIWRVLKGDRRDVGQLSAALANTAKDRNEGDRSATA